MQVLSLEDSILLCDRVSLQTIVRNSFSSDEIQVVAALLLRAVSDVLQFARVQDYVRLLPSRVTKSILLPSSFEQSLWVMLERASEDRVKQASEHLFSQSLRLFEQSNKHPSPLAAWMRSICLLPCCRLLQFQTDDTASELYDEALYRCKAMIKHWRHRGRDCWVHINTLTQNNVDSVQDELSAILRHILVGNTGILKFLSSRKYMFQSVCSTLLTVPHQDVYRALETYKQVVQVPFRCFVHAKPRWLSEWKLRWLLQPEDENLVFSQEFLLHVLVKCVADGLCGTIDTTTVVSVLRSLTEHAERVGVMHMQTTLVPTTIKSAIDLYFFDPHYTDIDNTDCSIPQLPWSELRQLVRAVSKKKQLSLRVLQSIQVESTSSVLAQDVLDWTTFLLHTDTDQNPSAAVRCIQRIQQYARHLLLDFFDDILPARVNVPPDVAQLVVSMLAVDPLSGDLDFLLPTLT
ncbi:MAG: hypothetical protein MHM6MM_001234 [Cercozoa sp. M6MM]